MTTCHALRVLSPTADVTVARSVASIRMPPRGCPNLQCVHDACTRAGEILASKTLDAFIGVGRGVGLGGGCTGVRAGQNEKMRRCGGSEDRRVVALQHAPSPRVRAKGTALSAAQLLCAASTCNAAMPCCHGCHMAPPNSSALARYGANQPVSQTAVIMHSYETLCAGSMFARPVLPQALDAALHFFKNDYQAANPRDAHFNLKLIAFSQLVRFRAITMLVRVRTGGQCLH